jgi:predicted DCC family thiol-disulfide oxidoreductase YuxK
MSPPALAPDTILVLYDGICGLCHGAVRFLLRHDQRDRFRFAALQSDFARQSLAHHRHNAEARDTVCVLVNFGQPEEKLLVKSDAALFALVALGGIWKVLGKVARVLPRFLRDAAYGWLARHRYRIFGTREACVWPDSTARHKFPDNFD